MPITSRVDSLVQETEAGLIYRRVADRVTQIDAGYAHTLLLTEKGDVWTFGCGLFGQMGNGDNKKVGLLVMIIFLWHIFGSTNKFFFQR